MIESLSKNRRKNPLVFKCPCGDRFVSNEYNPGLALPSQGCYSRATEKCPSCGKIVKRGNIYKPLLGSDQFNKYYG